MVLQESRDEMNRLRGKYGNIIMMSAWGFVIAIATFGFFYTGYLIDQRFGTQPTFMLGLLSLGVFLSVGRFYWEAWNKRHIQ
ncbi:MAG: AtpZ/AtpI family protein [Syntrophales bacterium]|nr:AtpZ/AtpI family protein [Syntrophales bacterium]